MTPESSVDGHGVCIDLDVDEAIALADALLPATGELGGRAEAPESHWFFASDKPMRTLRFSGPDKVRYVELLGQGSQVVVPPSVHPSGQVYVWARRDPPGQVDAAALRRATLDLAIGTLCMRCCLPETVEQVLTAAALPVARRTRLLAHLRGAGWSPVSAHDPAGLSTHIRAWLAQR